MASRGLWVTTWLTNRAETKRFAPCVKRQLKRKKLRATVTTTREGYMRVNAKSRRDVEKIHRALEKIERACGI